MHGLSVPVVPLAGPGPWARAARTTLGAVVASRLLLFAVGVLARRLAGLPDAPLDMWVHWDAAWYLEIATVGYHESAIFTGPMLGQANVVFFPAYPLLVRALAVGVPPVVAGLLVSNLCLLGAGVLLHRLAEARFGPAAARMAVLSLSFIPGSFVFSAVMTESLFLLVALGAFLCARQRAYLPAAALGAVACATRPTGAFLALALVVDWVHARLRTPEQEVDWREPLALSLAPLGLVAFMAYLDAHFGDAFAFMHVEQFWSRGDFQNPLRILLHALRVGDVSTRVGIATLVGVLTALGLARRVLSVGEWVFVALAVGLPLCTHLEGVQRYTIGLFPLHLALGVLLARRERRGVAVLLALGALNLLLMAFWSRGSNVFV